MGQSIYLPSRLVSEPDYGLLRVRGYGNNRTPSSLEDSAGVRNYLFCVGLDLPCNSRGSARGSATGVCLHAFLCCWRHALRLDATEGNALSVAARMGLHLR